MANEDNLIPFKKGKDERRNTNGRPKGAKNLSTIIRELENEEFDFSKIPHLPDTLHKELKKIGAPFRAMVYIFLGMALNGNVKAAEWLRKAGYGDKVDLTSKGHRIMKEPIYIPYIKPRVKKDANSQAETEGSVGSS